MFSKLCRYLLWMKVGSLVVVVSLVVIVLYDAFTQDLFKSVLPTTIISFGRTGASYILLKKPLFNLHIFPLLNFNHAFL